MLKKIWQVIESFGWINDPRCAGLQRCVFTGIVRSAPPMAMATAAVHNQMIAKPLRHKHLWEYGNEDDQAMGIIEGRYRKDVSE